AEGARPRDQAVRARTAGSFALANRSANREGKPEKISVSTSMARVRKRGATPESPATASKGPRPTCPAAATQYARDHAAKVSGAVKTARIGVTAAATQFVAKSSDPGSATYWIR